MYACISSKIFLMSLGVKNIDKCIWSVRNVLLTHGEEFVNPGQGFSLWELSWQDFMRTDPEDAYGIRKAAILRTKFQIYHVLIGDSKSPIIKKSSWLLPLSFVTVSLELREKPKIQIPQIPYFERPCGISPGWVFWGCAVSRGIQT